MAAVIAGWIAGYAMAILTTFALTFLAVKSPDLGAMKRWFPEMNPLLIAIPASILTTLTWTMAGLGFASAYELLDLGTKNAALGAPSGPFLIGIAAIGLMPLPFLLLVLRRFWYIWLVMSLSFIGIFGWFMPIMAREL